MEHVEWVDKKRGSAGTRQSGSNLGTDMSTLTYTCYDDLAFAVKNQVDSFFKVIVNLGNQSNYGFSAAAGLMQNGIGCIILLIADRLIKRIDPEGGVT